MAFPRLFLPDSRRQKTRNLLNALGLHPPMAQVCGLTCICPHLNLGPGGQQWGQLFFLRELRSSYAKRAKKFTRQMLSPLWCGFGVGAALPLLTCSFLPLHLGQPPTGLTQGDCCVGQLGNLPERVSVASEGGRWGMQRVVSVPSLRHGGRPSLSHRNLSN